MTAPVAIVTGAAAGIGEAIALRLARDGFSVLAVDRNAAEPAASGIRTLQQDVADTGAADRILAAAEALGPVAVLVNNAGVGGARSVIDSDDENWQRILDINLSAAFRLSRAVLPGMIARGQGGIVNMTSVFGLTGYRNIAAYAASKSAIAGLTSQMAADYGRAGIRVNAIAPGLIRTEMTERLLQDAAYRRLMLDGTPTTAPGLPVHVASAVAFLVSDEAAFINGVILPVDGGWSATRISVPLAAG